MLVAVLGATGRTGMALIAEAQRRDVGITALARPGAVAVPADRVVIGSLTSVDDLRRTVAGTTAVCCVFGPRPPFTDLFCAEATIRLLQAMRLEHVPRLVCVTGAMVGDYRANRTTPFELMARLFRRRAPDAARDRDEQERVVRASGLGWTLVKPPRLTNARARDPLRAAIDLRVGMRSHVSRAALARFLLDEALTPRFSGRAVFVTA